MDNASKIIDILGGTAEVARLCQTSMQAVSNWRRSGIPHVRLMYLQAVRPSAFAETAGAMPDAHQTREIR